MVTEMGKRITIRVLVRGGEAKPGPPLGPMLGQYGLPVGKVIAEINQKTKEWKGLRVPVYIHIDPSTRKYEVEVGTPTTAALILKKLGKTKGAGKPKHESIGSLKFTDVVEIAKIKMKDMRVKSLKAAIKTVLGVMVSMGVLVEGEDPRKVVKEVDEWMKKYNIPDEPVLPSSQQKAEGKS